jgi:hypothetical protein
MFPIFEGSIFVVFLGDPEDLVIIAPLHGNSSENKLI